MCVANDTSICNGTSNVVELLCETLHRIFIAKRTMHVYVDVRVLRNAKCNIMRRRWRLSCHESMEELHM